MEVGGADEQLTATLGYSNGSTSDVTVSAVWSSTDEAVATVSSGGLVTAVGEGSCQIEAEHAGFDDACAVTVTEP